MSKWEDSEEGMEDQRVLMEAMIELELSTADMEKMVRDKRSWIENPLTTFRMWRSVRRYRREHPA
jgi:hypothetical protein